MPSFFHQVRARANKINSLLCVGLDPHVSELPAPTATAAEQFCLDLIAQTSDVAVAYKPNAAFFEVFGAEGISALDRVIAAIPAEIPVLLDAKRGDISTTAAAYASAAFHSAKAHAITLAPYMGKDSIDPFINMTEYPEKGCFVLCKTSNPSADDFQTLTLGDGSMVYEAVAKKALAWNTHDNIGLVVGATDVVALRNVRRIVPDMWLLAPGLGAQGGNLEEAVLAGLSEDGFGLLLPVSRGISKAANPREAAHALRDAINVVRAMKLEQVQTQFLRFCLNCSVLKLGSFTLKSGRQSPYFFNAGLFKTGRMLRELGRFYAKTIHASGIEFDVLFGPAYKGITLAAAVAIAFDDLYGRDIPFAFNRKEAKDHGEGGVLVGADVAGKRVLLIDDVITAGTAITEAMHILSSAKANVVGVVISLDRQEKASVTDTRSAIQMVEASFKIPVVSIANLNSLVRLLEQDGEASGLSAADRQTYLTTIKQYRADYGVQG
ncbi:orotidine 5'-phosphate decarboxylase [Aphanomyces invadans]|uniref:Orotidine 5'-phosphate decarboxylase n=1 Tax=Aphanomyces invadans TaxID=157072 RepID=A0A024U872_9STRA|nr:orotidine 5'-phosphate decarboxylase [Aphanomyces invadans]ETW02102.1 orotidine 5'-phosphate decarboxylase [Aphanomyces invadans]|eukprot:XP_008868707.1 orotidine 5'-phosphate decarboxylase [Aphanomyces invadans]